MNSVKKVFTDYPQICKVDIDPKYRRLDAIFPIEIDFSTIEKDGFCVTADDDLVHLETITKVGYKDYMGRYKISQRKLKSINPTFSSHEALIMVEELIKRKNNLVYELFYI